MEKARLMMMVMIKYQATNAVGQMGYQQIE